MARELLWSLGPELNHIETYFANVGNPFAGWSIATSPAPDHGTYIFKGVSGSSNFFEAGNNGTFTAKNYMWAVLRGFRLTGTLASGNDVRFLTMGGSETIFRLNWVYETASTFKIKLVATSTDVFTSTNAFNVDQWYEIRVEWDGTNVTLWVDGTEEGEAAETDYPRTYAVILNKTTLSTGQEHYYRGWLLTQSDSESDRPGTAVENDRLDPTGNTSESDAGDDGGCGNTALGEYPNWDDYAAGGAPDDDTTWNCFDSGAERKEVSSLNTHTPTDTIEGVIYHLWARAATSGKTGNTHARIKEGANTSEVALAIFDGDVFQQRIAVFDLAPDGGAWTQGDVDALEAGLRSESANDVNIRASALAVELISVDDDPPPVPVQTANINQGSVIG